MEGNNAKKLEGKNENFHFISNDDCFHHSCSWAGLQKFSKIKCGHECTIQQQFIGN